MKRGINDGDKEGTEEVKGRRINRMVITMTLVMMVMNVTEARHRKTENNHEEPPNLPLISFNLPHS